MFLNLLIKDPPFDKKTALPEDIFRQFGDKIIRLGLEYMGVPFCLLYIMDQPKNEKELNGPPQDHFDKSWLRRSTTKEIGKNLIAS